MEKTDLWFEYMASLTDSVMVRKSLSEEMVFIHLLKRTVGTAKLH